MARFDKSGTKRTRQDAAVAAPRRAKKKPKTKSYEDTMFFPRLRRHAKWMFVFLAVDLGGGFVIFGVGAGGTGVGDLFRGSGGTSGVPSISSAQKRTLENPESVEAWRDLSTALQTDGQTERAIDAQRQVVALAPKDADALRGLAGLYLTTVTEKQRAAQLLQLRASYTGPGEDFPGALVAPSGETVVNDKISTVLNAQISALFQAVISEARVAASEAVTAYKGIVALQPDDPNVQLELAQAAQQAGDPTSAISAYEAFLKLAPDDPSASIVEQQLTQLKQSIAPSG